MNHQPKQFDVFLSYKSDDEVWVNQLKSSLQDRGVKVWLDQDQIRPGDIFAKALEDGIRNSRALVLVVTAKSLSSNWVNEEYYRALSLANKNELQLIPILLEDIELPGFLSSRHFIDFRDSAKFESNVDKLIWSGITGKKVVFIAVTGAQGLYDIPTEDEHLFEYVHIPHWRNLVTVIKDKGLKVEETEGLFYSQISLSNHLGYGGKFKFWDDLWNEKWDELATYYNPTNTRVVFITDIFEGTNPKTELHHSASPHEWTKLLFHLSKLTKGHDNEIVTVLYQKQNAWKNIKNKVSLSDQEIERLKHYFTLSHESADDGTLPRQFDNLWKRIQVLLLQAEHRLQESG